MTTRTTSLRLADIIGAIGPDFRYAYTVGGFKICRKCCKGERHRFALDPIWVIKTDAINRNKFLVCDHCGNRIPVK
jgi:hypothetical protein